MISNYGSQQIESGQHFHKFLHMQNMQGTITAIVTLPRRRLFINI